jgi:hypothetical protein
MRKRSNKTKAEAVPPDSDDNKPDKVAAMIDEVLAVTAAEALQRAMLRGEEIPHRSKHGAGRPTKYEIN